MIFNDNSNRIKASQEEYKGKIATLKDGGRIIVSDKFRYKNQDGTQGDFVRDLVFQVSIDGVEKEVKMTTTSRKECQKNWGPDSDLWVGKRCVINFIPFGDGSKKMIFLDPIIETKVFEGTKSKSSINAEDIVWKD